MKILPINNIFIKEIFFKIRIFTIKMFKYNNFIYQYCIIMAIKEKNMNKNPKFNFSVSGGSLSIIAIIIVGVIVIS